MPTGSTPHDFSAMRVLVIDDQEHVRKWVRRILKSLQITDVTEAEDGSQALACVAAPGHTFDLILCDLKMPNTDGVELIRKFAAMRMESAVVLLSMEPERVVETSALLAEEQGLRVLGALAKPLTVEKIEPLLVAELHRADASTGVETAEPPSRLRDDLLNGALHLLFQPRVSMLTGRVAGAEALVRWKHPDYGTVLPDLFVGFCENTPELGKWLLDYTMREALAFGARAREAGLDLEVAVNVHAGAFDDPDLPDHVELLARQTGTPPNKLTLELTERSVAQDAVRMLEVATRLRLKDFNLAVDDFGTGQSGLSQLRRLPFNQLKIDRQFVHGSTESNSKRSVVEASVALARNLQMTSVAEGVQRRPEWDLLQELGCEEMQGYFTGRPMTEEGFFAWAAQWGLNAYVPGVRA